jgi:hypothetical protein
VYTYTAREGRRESETRKRETHFSKECVFLCQFVGPSEGDEELRAVVIGACVGTAHEASPDKLESSVELILVDISRDTCILSPSQLLHVL